MRPAIRLIKINATILVALHGRAHFIPAGAMDGEPVTNSASKMPLQRFIRQKGANMVGVRQLGFASMTFAIILITAALEAAIYIRARVTGQLGE